MLFELHRAVESGDLESVKYHKKKGANINTFDRYGLSPLLIASSHSYNEIAKFLIAEGAEVNIGCRFTNNPPLLFACLRGNVELVDMLIKNGANVEEWILDFISTNNIIDDTFIKLIKLSIPALLWENPTICKPGYVENITELSSFWDEQTSKIKPFLEDKSLYNKETRESILEKISRDRKKTTLLSLAFFKLPTIKDNVSEVDKIYAVQFSRT